MYNLCIFGSDADVDDDGGAKIRRRNTTQYTKIREDNASSFALGAMRELLLSSF